MKWIDNYFTELRKIASEARSFSQFNTWKQRLHGILEQLADILWPKTPVPAPVPVRVKAKNKIV